MSQFKVVVFLKNGLYTVNNGVYTVSENGGEFTLVPNSTNTFPRTRVEEILQFLDKEYGDFRVELIQV